MSNVGKFIRRIDGTVKFLIVFEDASEYVILYPETINRVGYLIKSYHNNYEVVSHDE